MCIYFRDPNGEKMGLFIELEIDRAKCVGLSKCGMCVKVCPVQIFGESGDVVKVGDPLVEIEIEGIGVLENEFSD